MPADRDVFDNCIDTVHRRFGPDAPARRRDGPQQIVLNDWAVALDGHVRTGLEDNVLFSLLRPSRALERRPGPSGGRDSRPLRPPRRQLGRGAGHPGVAPAGRLISLALGAGLALPRRDTAQADPCKPTDSALLNDGHLSRSSARPVAYSPRTPRRRRSPRPCRWATGFWMARQSTERGRARPGLARQRRAARRGLRDDEGLEQRPGPRPDPARGRGQPCPPRDGGGRPRPIHPPAPAQDLYVDSWRALIRLRRRGGCARSACRIPPAHLDRLVDQTGVVPVLNQIEPHPRLQQAGLRALHDSLGIVTQSWTPLGGAKASMPNRSAPPHAAPAAPRRRSSCAGMSSLVFPSSRARPLGDGPGPEPRSAIRN